jgi:RNA polymerase sigma-70 factor (ECF subfamily)
LNGIFNPKQDDREELLKIKMVNAGQKESKPELYNLRTRLVKSIDPLNADGTNLHEFMMQNVRQLIGEVK